jgi:hypothetical protein
MFRTSATSESWRKRGAGIRPDALSLVDVGRGNCNFLQFMFL